MVAKGAPLPLRHRFALHNHDSKLAFATWSSGVLETRVPNPNLKATQYQTPYFNQEYVLSFLIGWVARSRGEAVAEPVLIAVGVKYFKRCS